MKGAINRITETILFGKYRIISTLGTGSSSTVYLAEHLKLKVYRAIKQIPKNNNPIASLSLESSILKNLSHPGIPVIYDIDEDDSFIYMTEEFIQGESLDTFVCHQNYITEELIINFGIQLCGILDYLHHLLPYPILYQDLKPEHIILCGNQLKLVDFGIASFFTGSNKHFQFYGTKDYAAPEIQDGSAVTPLSDLYSLGKVLLFLIDTSGLSCSSSLLSTIQKSCAHRAADRYETVSLFQSALEKERSSACSSVSHLTKNILVLGSKHGVGTTHIAISLVSILNQNGFSSCFCEENNSDSLRAMMRTNHSVKEENGFFYYRFFQGIPHYGSGIDISVPKDCVCVKDCGVYSQDITELDPESLLIFVVSGSEWDMEHTIAACNKLINRKNTFFLCNYENKNAAKNLARVLQCKIYSFPFDSNAFSNTAAKESLLFHLLSIDGSAVLKKTPRRHNSNSMERGSHKFLPFKRK